MVYESPFRAVGSEHEGLDHACMSRAHHVTVDPSTDTRDEFFETFVNLVPWDDEDAPEYTAGGPVLFFLGRHVVELAIKSWIPGKAPHHRLDDLLAEVPPGHAIWKGDDAADLREFIADLSRADPGGDQGRYGSTRKDTPSLADVCCMDPRTFAELVAAVHTFGERPEADGAR